MVNEDNSTLIKLIETLADNKLVLGDQLVEIGISGPNLEATLAAVSIAQSELGHARLLYNWVHELKSGGKREKRPDIQNQTGKAFATAIGSTDWLTLIASLYATNVATDIVLHAIASSSKLEKLPSFEKLLREQDEHIMYARNWCEQLTNDRGRIPVKFQSDLATSLEETADWLNGVQTSDLFERLGVSDQLTDLVTLFEQANESVVKTKELAYGS